MAEIWPIKFNGLHTGAVIFEKKKNIGGWADKGGLGNRSPPVRFKGRALVGVRG